MKIFYGNNIIPSKKIGIIVGRFNNFITKRLLDACLDELKKLGVKDQNIIIVWVPGAFEIPLAALKLAKMKTVDAIICLGAVIKGQTHHFELVSRESARGLAQVSLMTEKPVIFEILATDTIEQADKRSQIKGHNKGRDAAQAAVEMLSVLRHLK